MLRITLFLLFVLAATSKLLAQGASYVVDMPLDVRSGMLVDFDFELRRSLNSVGEEAIATAQMTSDEIGNAGFAATYTLSSLMANGMRIEPGKREAMRYFPGAPVNFIADYDGTSLRIADRERLVRDVLASGIDIAELSEQELEAIRTLEYREATTCTVDIDSGWVRQLTHNSNAVAMGESMSESCQLKISTNFPSAQ